MEEGYFNIEEKSLVVEQCKKLIGSVKDLISLSDINNVHSIIKNGVLQDYYHRDKYGINPTTRNLSTALLVTEYIGPDRNMVIAILLYNLCKSGFISIGKINELFGADVEKMVSGLIKVSELYQKQAAVEDENFRNLLITFAQDIRVIIIMIVDRLGIMRIINHHPNEKFVYDISKEARYLYAPLAHRLGLYTIKSELEDLSLKYMNRTIYTQIAHKLNATKTDREQYIDNFIKPVKLALEKAGLKFEIKGRTKSINSIWHKMQVQNTDIDHIYDLFAIRIILDTPVEREKADCWVVYSIVTDMYTANPARLKDWLTIPKSNGYESLHITVNGPEERWVEVQIRSRRMDEIAESGLAAHWRYKGIKSEKGLDEWMNNVRDLLETENGTELIEMMSRVKMDLYNKEVFVFTPKGDLFKLPMGATILDFAFQIHSRIGCTCTGGKVDGKNQKINYKLKSGDTIEILTSNQQSPKLDWLNFVVTSKARNKIKQAVNEMRFKAAELGKELIQRRFKNRKIEIDEAIMMKVFKKLGFKTATDFFDEVENLDINNIIDTYLSFEKKDVESQIAPVTAKNFVLQQAPEKESDSSEVLVIGENLKGINYKLSKCCNPIYGDDIAGFVASDGAIKIHRSNCGNLKHLIQKYPYRKIDVAWSGKVGSQYAVTLRIVGQDDISIVTNITSVISKEENATLRNISIDSNDGLFQGILVLGINDRNSLNEIIKKIKNVKGVKDVQRSDN